MRFAESGVLAECEKYSPRALHWQFNVETCNLNTLNDNVQ